MIWYQFFIQKKCLVRWPIDDISDVSRFPEKEIDHLTSQQLEVAGTRL